MCWLVLAFHNSQLALNFDFISALHLSLLRIGLDVAPNHSAIIMDPLSALSLAGNIVQFVDFGADLLSSARELYKSPVGSLLIHDEVALVTSDLEMLVNRLRSSMPPRLDSEANEAQWKALRELCDKAAAVADELLKRLGTLKQSANGKHRRWESLHLAVRSLWNEKEIKSLLERLSALKEALNTRILFSLRLVIIHCHIIENEG